MTSTYIILLKFIFICVLTFILVNFFGKPSLERYLEKSTIFIDEQVDYDIDNPPAILVSRSSVEEIIESCLSFDVYQEAVKCIDDKLPSRDQIFAEVGISNNTMYKQVLLESWEMDFDELWWRGKMYSLRNYRLQHYEWLNLRFFNAQITMEIFDPNFYTRSYKYLTVPKYQISLKPGESTYLEIQGVQINLINKPSKSCNNSKDYSFTKCVEVISI